MQQRVWKHSGLKRRYTNARLWEIEKWKPHLFFAKLVGSSQQDTVVGFLISQNPSKMTTWITWRERIQVSTNHTTEISSNFYWILCGWMVLHWRPVGTLVLKASHIWNANGKRPSRFPSWEKGNEVGSEAISHTFFGLSPILCLMKA